MLGYVAPVVMRILAVEDLYELIDDAEADAALPATVTDLTIELTGPVPVVALRQCLSMTTNVTDLILLLPSDAPAHLLVGLPLPKLEFFKTNLPHRHLLPFVNHLPRLSILCLDACGRDAIERICPLSGADLSSVRTIECPAGCASRTARKELTWLTVEDRPSVASIRQALRPFPASSLSYLCLDFFPDDYDVLQEIISAVPRLQKLKLLEKHRSTRRNLHSRRAWNDVANWSRCLLKLPYLEELMLRTAAPFVSVPASVPHEKTTLLRWISGTDRQAKHRPRHPTLNHIRVWYRCRDPGNGIITHWSRYTGMWCNTLLMRDPLVNTLF